MWTPEHAGAHRCRLQTETGEAVCLNVWQTRRGSVAVKIERSALVKPRSLFVASGQCHTLVTVIPFAQPEL